MAIKYECDTCHKVVDPADTYGQGVAPEGRAFMWNADVAHHPALKIIPITKDEPSHTCGKCLGIAVRTMVDQIWPIPIPAGYTPKEITDDGDPGSDSSDSDVREVRPEPEVSGSGPDVRVRPDVYHSPGTGQKCSSCRGLLINASLAGCEQPDHHPDPPRRIRDNPQA